MEIGQGTMELKEKLRILSDAAKYDAACTSSGVDRPGKPGALGNASAAGICHSFASDGRCISLLKILLTNHCIYDCKYCINRRSNDVERTAFTPDEVCALTIEFYRRNYIEGLFLSSGVMKSPDHTMAQVYEVLYKLREVYQFRGYIHVKAIPGADAALIDQIGLLADRMSINLELPTAESLRSLAPHKSRQTILGPMRQIQAGIADSRLSMGQTARLERAYGAKSFSNGIFRLEEGERDGLGKRAGHAIDGRDLGAAPVLEGYDGRRGLARRERNEIRTYVPAGQSTQIIVGATPESDYHMMMVTQALYQKYDLKRVFFSAYVGINEDSALPAPGEKPPLLREHRLYQADWLLRFYGFRAEELLSEDKPNFNVFLDPKCDWAVRHLEYFPVEINLAAYELLLRVPGIGAKSARRIIQARRMGKLDFPDLKKLGVVLKRAHYFITCGGRQMYPVKLEENRITAGLISDSQKKNWQIEHQESFRQLSLFDDMKLEIPPTVEDFRKAAAGQL
ncbi:putative DNA modification/repair radical SAM protein [Qiania dongpingensis]|uniref:Putative DNA modification/repair radical SAM protein n=1 Tax=Qiania dongpingensis TaxID=2763669 RepID=A0A7G9G414_9FIRM|nr:putative DNA modification/repair radical SAM protein [Qiania dongpingensis]QNM05546.1 putative DNA modification/repair radical SAM protein [Qiania dongpingensis]